MTNDLWNPVLAKTVASVATKRLDAFGDDSNVQTIVRFTFTDGSIFDFATTSLPDDNTFAEFCEADFTNPQVNAYDSEDATFIALEAP